MTTNDRFPPEFDEAKIKNIIEHYEDWADNDDLESDDTSLEEIKVSLKQALQEVKESKTIPLEQMWNGIDV